ncbi:MAG: peptide chain release factor N(5)-glutamine methyltransferase [Chlorobia bacterium]|nr:peptide chain release factor N(5)-glutamine methyltransferase [Fimbriimonadaceae bacterium]
MNLQVWLTQASERLAAAGVDSHRLEAQLLAAHLFLVDRTWIVAHPEAEVNELAAETLLQRRENREPLAYIVGWREFYGRRFEVAPGVLIPRQETEVLLETALRLAHEGPVLDLGTGSGCLAITLKLERPEIEVWASDISPRALAIARRNAAYHEAKVNFVQSNLFHNFPSIQFEHIISNPPYIADDETLMPEVRNHEPAGALFSGPTGLEFYETLAREAPPYLGFIGKLAVEVGHTQAWNVVNLLIEHGWPNDYVVSDLSGIDRVVVSTRPD